MGGLVALAVRRRVSVLMATLAVTAFGVVGYQRLAVELFPDITYPSLTVQTDFPDTAPQEVETMITRPVEEAVGVLRGLERMHSVSRSGVSEVTLEFAWGSEMGGLAMDVREKLDRLVLPEGAEHPIVLRFDPSLDPIVRIALTGDDDLTKIRYLADHKIKPDFETIRGVAAAQIRGGQKEEIRVEIDQERLAALGIPIEQVRAAVGVSNINLPGGALRGSEDQFLIRTLNELDSVDEIAGLVVRQEGARAVRLLDVAKVYRGSEEREEITRVGGRECVELSIFKEGDANAVSAARLIAERVEAWQAKLPEGYALTVLFDQSRFIEQAVEEVRSSALIGGALAVLLLFLFLRDLRSTFIIATAIPLSVVATFLFMYRMDISLNVVSLGGLTLGIGMLVDNSIVVLESIFRRRQSGDDLYTAAVEGTQEVGAAVIASTLTTIAVFLPIVFVEGVAGELFADQAFTVTISLLASLVVALTVIPTLAAAGRGGPSARSAPTEEVETLGALSRVYDRVLRLVLRARWATVGIGVASFVLSAVALRDVEAELIPSLTSGQFFFELKMPEGTSLAATDRVVKKMEEAAESAPGAERYYAMVGSRLVAGGMAINTKAENLAQLDVVMAPGSGEEKENELAARLRDDFRDIPDAQVKLGRPSYFSMQTPIEIAIFGDELEELRTYSLALAARLSEVQGLVDVRSSLEAGNPELQVVFDRRRLASLGLDMEQLSMTLQQRVQGVVPTRFKEEDRQIDIRILNEEGHRTTVQDVRRLVLPGPDGQPIRLLSVADVIPARGPAEIHRLQQQRAALVTANLQGKNLGVAVADVERVMAELPLPAGMTSEIGGQNREMNVSFASLRFALALAVFLVYLVMASTFESLVHPFVVLFTIPLALVGVVLGLLATNTTITVIVLIGGIMLVGIVVNNAIVLIDAINRLRRSGVPRDEAIVRAGHTRLRPILMTTLTTSLALLPMALGWGEGAELRRPLAITVASGLTFCTILTLLVIPAVYALVPAKIEDT